MNYNKETQEIFCHICRKWLDKYVGVYYEGDIIRCLTCNVVLGYSWDFANEKNQSVVLGLQTIDKIVHDVKFGLADIIKICRSLSELSISGEDLLKRLSEMQDILNEAIEHLNNE